MLEQAADLTGYLLPFQGRVHGAAAGMAEHENHFHSQRQGGELDAADIFMRRQVAGDPIDEQVAESLIEDDFDGHARIRAA